MSDNMDAFLAGALAGGVVGFFLVFMFFLWSDSDKTLREWWAERTDPAERASALRRREWKVRVARCITSGMSSFDAERIVNEEMSRESDEARKAWKAAST